MRGSSPRDDFRPQSSNPATTAIRMRPDALESPEPSAASCTACTRQESVSRRGKRRVGGRADNDIFAPVNDLTVERRKEKVGAIPEGSNVHAGNDRGLKCRFSWRNLPSQVRFSAEL